MGAVSFSNSVKVGSAPGTYKLQLIATDMAGNEAIANATFIVEETVTEVLSIGAEYDEVPIESFSAAIVVNVSFLLLSS